MEKSSCLSFFCLAATTHDQEVFSFYPEEKPCNGFEEVLQRYRELVPHLKLAGWYSTGDIFSGILSHSSRNVC